MSELEDCTNLTQRVQRVVSEEIMPQLQMDGLNLEVMSVQDGVVQVRFLGLCTCCPGTVHAILMGVEQELRQRVPEVEYLETVP